MLQSLAGVLSEMKGESEGQRERAMTEAWQGREGRGHGRPRKPHACSPTIHS